MRQRVVNRRLLKEVAKLPCIVCWKFGCDPCHVKTKGSGGPDLEWNLVPLCRLHHIEQHQMGIVSFYRRYPQFRWALKQRGWVLEGEKLVNERLVNYEEGSLKEEV